MVIETLWPKGGWARAARYVRLRLNRLPDPPHRIARGIFAGVFTTFTPFYGLHFFVAAFLALILRGNVIAALMSTFFGNPLTYVPIGVASLKTGYWLLDMGKGPHPQPADHHGNLVEKFFAAGADLWDNLLASAYGETSDWTRLSIFYDEVFYPYMIGSILPGAICGLIAYYVSLPLISAFQNRRKGVIKAKLAELKRRKAEAAKNG